MTTTLLVLVPVLGLFVYGSFRLFPSEQEESLRASESDTDSEDS